MSNVVKLLEKCDEVSRRNYLNLVNLSFLGNLKNCKTFLYLMKQITVN